MVKTVCLLANVCRYLIAFVPVDDVKIFNSKTLSELRWVSFQTRTLDDKHEIKSFPYTPKRGSELDAVIKKVQVTSDSVEYSCKDIPIIINLLHQGKNVPSYQEKGTVVSALETFQTIITLDNIALNY